MAALPLFGLAAGLAGGAMSVFGKKDPVAPKLTGIDPKTGQVNYGGALEDSVGANLGIFGPASKLSSQTNAFELAEQAKIVDTATPEARKFFQAGFETVDKWMAGEIPKDVAESIGRASAQASTMRGFGAGSGMSRNLVARDLGLTSLDLISRGISTGSSLLGQKFGMYGVERYGVANSFGTPAMAMQNAQFNARNALAVAQYNSGIKNQAATIAADIANNTPSTMEKFGSLLQGIGGSMFGFGSMGGGGAKTAGFSPAPFAAGYSYNPGMEQQFVPMARRAV